MKIRLALFFLIFTTILKAQSAMIEGVVRDSISTDLIEYASVRLLDAKDSSFVRGTVSSEKGVFNLKVQPEIKYLIEISYLGYKNHYTEIQLKKGERDKRIGDVLLVESGVVLDEMLVVGKVPPVVVKGDTIEYHAGAYQVSEGDALQDVVRNIPGMELDANGGLKVNGRAIDKILVNGREFFGNDIAMALRELPASMINKIQLFKKASEEEEHTGFKDGEEEQVLNLTVKEDIKHSIFGKLDAGYGTEDRYKLSGNTFYMKDETQLAGLFSMQNVNDDGYGAMSIGSFGIDENKNGGFNFSLAKPKKWRSFGDVSFSDNKNVSEDESESETFLATGNRYTTQTSKSVSKNKNLGGRASFEWTPDTLTRVNLSLSLSRQDNESVRQANSLSYVKDTTWTNTDNRTKGDSESVSLNLMLSRELNKKNRRLTLGFNTSFRDGKSDGLNKSETTYSLVNQDPHVLDQQTKSTNNSNSFRLSSSYTEPISEKSLLILSYALSSSKGERDREALKKDVSGAFAIVDTAYTRFSKNDYLGHDISLGYQYRKDDKWYYSMSLMAQASTSTNQTFFRDSVIDDVRQSVVNYVPSLNFMYRFKESSSLSVNYRGATSQPSLSQLSSDTIMTNATNRRFGNPNLKPSYVNDLSLSYSTSNSEKQTYFYTYASLSYTLNKIADYSLIDDLGSYSTTYRNVDGDMSAFVDLTYGFPIKKLNVYTSTGLNYSRNRGFINAEQSETNNYGVNQRLGISYNSDKINANFQANIQYNFTSTNLENSDGSKNISSSLSSNLTWRMPLGFELMSMLNYSYNGGYSDNFKKGNLWINMSVNKSFMKAKRASLKLYINNVLDTKSGVQRSVSDSYISYSKSNSLGRYVMLSFSYKFKIFGGGGADSSEFMY